MADSDDINSESDSPLSSEQYQTEINGLKQILDPEERRLTYQSILIKYGIIKPTIFEEINRLMSSGHCSRVR